MNYRVAALLEDYKCVAKTVEADSSDEAISIFYEEMLRPIGIIGGMNSPKIISHFCRRLNWNVSVKDGVFYAYDKNTKQLISFTAEVFSVSHLQDISGNNITKDVRESAREAVFEYFGVYSDY